MLACFLFIVAAMAAYFCYHRAQALTPMLDQPVTEAQATITRVDTPMVKKNETVSEVNSQVTLLFTVAGTPHLGGYSVKGNTGLPKEGDKEPVVYLTSDPNVFLRAEEFAELPRQLMALKVLMWLFGVFAIVLPVLLTLKKN